MRYFWRLWGAVEKANKIDDSRAVVVLGFPRSGTSIVSRLVQACGVNFGDNFSMRPADSRNPGGYLEHVVVNRIDNALMREAGHQSTLAYDATRELRARGFVQRAMRLMTRRKMLRVLSRLSSSNTTWGIKLFPVPFHIWREYMPKVRIIGVYRNPVANADSLVRTFKRQTLSQALQLWAEHNRELLYHLSRHQSILVNQDALSDDRREQEVARIAAFLGEHDTGKLLDILEREKTLVRSALRDEDMPNEVVRVWQALEHAHQHYGA